MASAYDDSSSDDSEDEFLTGVTSSTGTGKGGEDGGGKTEADREALIRKKLLESFYGADAAAELSGGGADPRSDDNDDDDDEKEEEEDEKDSQAVKPSPPPPPPKTISVDLDSTTFSASAHTRQHISKSTVYSLLETDERLALDIRSLDSTMQTIVYENYSKFIDATDAIRSIGRSVESSEAGLSRLKTGIEHIDTLSTQVDTALRSSREAVAEKLRVKRLLTRLDALLKLPKTLKQQIDSGMYRLAAKSHASATAILGKHSAGFESLRSIELECNVILKSMVQDLRNKLMHWSGEELRRTSAMSPFAIQRRKIMDENNALGDSTLSYDDDNDDLLGDEDLNNDLDFDHPTSPLSRRGPPTPPKDLAEIFECAGTLMLFSNDTPSIQDSDDEDYNHDSRNLKKPPPEYDSGLAKKQCKSLALDACAHLLEQILDAHLIDVQNTVDEVVHDDDVFLSTPINQDAKTSSSEIGQSISSLPPQDDAQIYSSRTKRVDGTYLVPSSVLDGVLESVTLFGVCLGANPARGESISPEDQALLEDFVSEMFGSFLGNVRAAILERTSQVKTYESNDKQQQQQQQHNNENDEGEDENDEEDAAFKDVSDALTFLVHSVRELASGLALPEVGLDFALASGLVDQAVEVTESTVRRHVARKFYALRLQVTEECIVPFATKAMEVLNEASDSSTDATTADGSSGSKIVQVVQMASVTLSDGMQLVDDLVRSTLSEGSIFDSTSTPVDSDMVRLAVERNVRRFAFWLAGALEILSGCDDSDTKVTLDVRPVPKETIDDDGRKEPMLMMMMTTPLDDEGASLSPDDAETHHPKGEEEDKATLAIHQRLSQLDEDEASSSNLALVVAEMCRLAERSVAASMNQSISTYISNATSRQGRFSASSVRGRGRVDVNSDGTIARRFHTAASRALRLYGTSRGSVVSDIAMMCVLDVANSRPSSLVDGGIPESITSFAWQMLEVVKGISIQCAMIFGGERFADPVSSFPDAADGGGSLQRVLSRAAGGGGVGHMTNAIKGLQLDVERMFTEKVLVYPSSVHPMEFSRNAIVVVILKMAFRAMMECSRLCTFTSTGYRQMQADIEFLRHMVPHYVRDEALTMDGTNGRTSLFTLLDDIMISVGERCVDEECVGVDEYFDEVSGRILSPLNAGKKFMESERAKEGGGVTDRFVIKAA